MDTAIKRVAAQMRAMDPRGAPNEGELKKLLPEEVRSKLEAATEALNTIRESSGYHWVNLGQLFGVTVK